MPGRDLIAIGGSAGALEPLITLIKHLPRQIPAALFVVLHTSPESNGCLPQILERGGKFPARFPQGDERIEPGVIYVAPPDKHLIVSGDDVAAVDGPKENGFRPAVDPLFRSLAHAHPVRTVGVILSGALDDGMFGLMAIKQAGGLAIVQHPYEALVPSMPLAAIQNVEVDHIVRSDEIARHLAEAVWTPAPEPAASHETSSDDARDDAAREERDITLAGISPEQFDRLQGPPSHFTCPECGGSLWEIQQGGRARYRCHTGHGFTPQALLYEQNVEIEAALWSAVRTFQERAALHRNMSRKASERPMAALAATYESRALEEESKAETLRRLLVPHPAEVAPSPAHAATSA